MESGHEFEPGIEIGTDFSHRPTKPGHTTASLDAMSLHSICHSAYRALVSQDVFGELSVEINQNHEEKVASKDFLCFLFGVSKRGNQSAKALRFPEHPRGGGETGGFGEVPQELLVQ